MAFIMFRNLINSSEYESSTSLFDSTLVELPVFNVAAFARFSNSVLCQVAEARLRIALSEGVHSTDFVRKILESI